MRVCARAQPARAPGCGWRAAGLLLRAGAGQLRRLLLSAGRAALAVPAALAAWHARVEPQWGARRPARSPTLLAPPPRRRPQVPSRYGERNGGYCRVKAEVQPRRGDNVEMATIELV